MLLAVPSALVAVPRASAQTYREEIAELVGRVEAARAEIHPAAELVGKIRKGRVRVRGARRFPIVLPAGRCYVAIAEADVGGPVQIHASLMRGGTDLWPLSRDLMAELEGALPPPPHYCTGEERQRLQLVVSISSTGRGRIIRPGEPPDPGTPFAAAVYGFPPPDESLPSRFASEAETHRRDARALGEPGTARLAEGASEERELRIVAGCCYRVVAVGAVSMGDVDLQLLAPDGEVVDHDGAEGGTATLGVVRPICPEASGMYRLVVRAARGAGDVRWQVFAAPRP